MNDLNKHITITPDVHYSIFLQSITEKDLENLRIWKNANNSSFFYKGIISPEQQTSWYQDYLQREFDYMFMVKDINQNSIGCLGFRLINNHIDLYNIIRGNHSTLHTSMKDAMYIMLNYITKLFIYPVQCDVLKNNPAVSWYKKCGFAILKEFDYYIMTIDSSQIPKIDIIIKEE